MEDVKTCEAVPEHPVLPDHELKVYPELAVAVIVTLDPEVYVPPPLTVPPAVGLAARDTVYVATKFAVHAVAAVSENE
jgi:predicted cobalt transporter CbtA